MAKEKKSSSKSKSSQKLADSESNAGHLRLYTLSVSILSGLIDEEFVDENPEISRTIQIRGDQTLEDLHDGIFEAFDRFDDHMYEFQLGKRQHEPPRYVLSMAGDADFGAKPAGFVENTTIDSLGLKKGRCFGYWFDFGDDWWHTIEVMDIESDIPAGKYPRITNRVGKSPPQYPDIDGE